MRLPRNIKMLRGPVDPSALAGTMFLLWIATFLHSSLVLPPGVRLELPEAAGVWGEVLPRWSVAVDPAGRILFEHQMVSEADFEARLREGVTRSETPGTLLLMADRRVTLEVLTRLQALARGAGIRDVVLATSPRPGGPWGTADALLSAPGPGGDR
ncbi:MAG: biopolymer transporter ExbD [Verrucomicrobiae bacterium]|nr:biopolymer transporter ExbD [Verrucomicrobiae bacterium]